MWWYLCVCGCVYIQVRFQHVGREDNKLAHNIARHAHHVTGFNVWMEDVPVHCLDVYQADMPLS